MLLDLWFHHAAVTENLIQVPGLSTWSFQATGKPPRLKDEEDEALLIALSMM